MEVPRQKRKQKGAEARAEEEEARWEVEEVGKVRRVQRFAGAPG